MQIEDFIKDLQNHRVADRNKTCKALSAGLGSYWSLSVAEGRGGGGECPPNAALADRQCKEGTFPFAQNLDVYISCNSATVKRFFPSCPLLQN